MVRPMGIGIRIKKARKLRKMSQEELAALVGVKQPSVSEWEREISNPTMDSLAMVASIMKVRLDWLGKGEGEMEESAGYAELTTAETKPLETQLLEIFRAMSWTNQQALIDFLQKWK